MLDFETEGIVHPDAWTFSFHTHLKDKNQTTAVACDNDRISLNRRNRFPGKSVNTTHTPEHTHLK